MQWKKRDPYIWRRWFAWRPVTIGRSFVWLEWVERRWERPVNIDDLIAWEYRDASENTQAAAFHGDVLNE